MIQKYLDFAVKEIENYKMKITASKLQFQYFAFDPEF